MKNILLINILIDGVQNIIMKDNNDLQRIIDKYAKYIYRIAFTYLRRETDAEDIVQEVLMKYCINEKPYSSETHEKNWIVRVTLNCCHNVRYSAWRKHTVALENNEEIKFETEVQTDLFCSVDKLKEKYKTVIQLFYFEDMSIKSISEVLNISEANVKTRLRRARAMLKIDLEEGEDF